MKGVLLTRKLGSRPSSLTKATQQALLPVYSKPIIFYPVEALVEIDITEALMITGGKSASDFIYRLSVTGPSSASTA